MGNCDLKEKQKTNLIELLKELFIEKRINIEVDDIIKYGCNDRRITVKIEGEEVYCTESNIDEHIWRHLPLSK